MSKNQSIDGKLIRKWYKENSGQKPQNVDGQIATRTEFYRQEIEKIVKSLFEVSCPDEWDLTYFLNTLIRRGYIAISTTPAGVLPIHCSLTGLNYISLPTTAIMTAPMLGNWENEINKDCVIIFLDRIQKTQYFNFNQFIQIYAQRLANADASVDVNLMNSKMAYIAEAETKAQAESVKQLYAKISDGEPLVVYRKDSLAQGSAGMQLFTSNVKQNYIADMAQDTKRSIINEILTFVGINNANTDKKERLITGEVDSNNTELKSNVDIWRDNLKRQMKWVRKVFPDLDFNIRLRYREEMEREVEQLATQERSGDMGDKKPE